MLLTARQRQRTVLSPNGNTAGARENNLSYFQMKGRRLYTGVSSSYTNVYNTTAPRIEYSSLVPSATAGTSGMDFLMGGALHSALPGATVVLPKGRVTILHLSESNALAADEIFTGPMNIVLNGTNVSLFRVVEDVGEASQPTVTSANIPHGIQIIKNSGATIPVGSNIQCDVYNITVENIEGFSLDVTDTVGTYAVNGGEGVAYTTVGNKVYYSVNGKLTVPAALNADKKWTITVDDYNVNLVGDGTLTTDAPYNYYVALVGQKALGFNVGRFSDPVTGYDATWLGGDNNASLDTYVADQWATVTFDLWAQRRYDGSKYVLVFEELLAQNPDAVISDLRVRPFAQTAGSPALAAGEEFYVADYIFTDYDPRTSLDTYYVSEDGTASGDGASLETALNSVEAVYELADASGFSEVDVYIDGTVSAGTLVKNEYTGITLNILPLNASGDKITELNAVANLNLGAVAIDKLNLISGIVTNNAATIGNVAVGNVTETQFNQLGGSLGAITQTAGTAANKVVFFVSADSKLPAADVTANQFSIVRAPLMMNDKKTVRFSVTPTNKIGVFETYSGSAYQFLHLLCTVR